MRIGVLISVICLAISAAACQPAEPTVVYVVITDTPGAATSVPSPRAAQPATATPVPPTATPVATVTPTPDPVPTEAFSQVQVAEQVFENGRMFWLQPYSQIWVLVLDGEGEGEWLRYNDTFVEGEDPEDDPDINPPDGFYEPQRGFGKLWRETPEVRDALGWGITPEFGYISEYRYQPTGDVVDGEFEQTAAEHQVLSLNSEAFCLYEETGRWKLGC